MTTGLEHFDPPSEKVESIADAYRRAYDTLVAGGADIFNGRADRDLRTLVTAMKQPLTQEETAAVLRHRLVTPLNYRMWSLIYKAEAAMERFYARELDGRSVWDFKYLNDYGALVAAELGMLGFPQRQLTLKENESVMFVGAGPLPLSAFHMARMGLPVTCIDRDRQSVEMGNELIRRCGLTDAVRYLQAEGEDYEYYLNPTVIVSTREANRGKVLNNICDMHGVRHLLVRSSVGVNTLLYPYVTGHLTTMLEIKFDRQTREDPAFLHTTLLCYLMYYPELKRKPPVVYRADSLDRLSLPLPARLIRNPKFDFD